jgi:hypothetical protein
MPKRGAKKRSEDKEDEDSMGKSRKDNLQKMLIENFVSLQDVMANLSEKINNLAGQMSKLLELFELSAKTFMEKDLKFGGSQDKELISKLDRLIEQNKIIAQGITMLYEEKGAQSSRPESLSASPLAQQAQENINRYQRSISSKQDAKIQPRPGTGQ